MGDAKAMSALAPSDILQLRGVYAVHPVTHETLPFLQWFMFVRLNDDGTLDLYPPCPCKRIEDVLPWGVSPIAEK